MNFLNFLFCNLFVTGLFFLLLLTRKITKKQISVKARYYLDYLFVLALILPFIPQKIFHTNPLAAAFSHLFFEQASKINHLFSEIYEESAFPASLGLYDYAPAADTASSQTWNLLLGTLWGMGFLITGITLLRKLWNLHKIRKNSFPVTADSDPELYHQYQSSLQELHLRRQIPLYASCQIDSPLSYGILFPRILIPQDLDIQISKEDLRFIFLHEILHYCHRDSILNELACVLQAIYWFNPAARLGLRLLQTDREYACDYSVVTLIGQKQAPSYARTLLRYARQAQKHVFLSPFSSLGSAHTELFCRIDSIINYQTVTWPTRLKSFGILILTFLLILFSSPRMEIFAGTDDAVSFAGKNVETIDLSSYFPEKNGTFILYDISRDSYQVYNPDLGIRRCSPDSTFKIYSALFALQENCITPDSTKQAWNNQSYPFDSWNQDQTLATAMRDSVNWYFQALDTQVGKDRLAAYYRQISYGNCDLTAGIQNYWAESSLKISPLEQTALLADLWMNRWDYEEENIQAVKDAMYLTDTSFGRLYGKTGTGQQNGHNVRGWFIGFLERNEQVYCFALQLQDSSLASGTAASTITFEILSNLFS